MCTMSHHGDCGPLCLYRIMPFLEGFVVIVLGVFLFMTNYGFMDASIWKWLLPLVVMLVGFKWITTGAYGNDCCDDMMDDCYDMNMMCCEDDKCECGGEKACGCDDEECGCENSDECECEGKCTCGKGDKEGGMCGCGDSCGCGSKK